MFENTYLARMGRDGIRGRPLPLHKNKALLVPYNARWLFRVENEKI